MEGVCAQRHLCEKLPVSSEFPQDFFQVCVCVCEVNYDDVHVHLHSADVHGPDI